MAVRGRADDVERVGDRHQASRAFQELAERLDLVGGPVGDVLQSAISDFAALAIGLAEKGKPRLDSLIDARPSRQRDLVTAMIAARILDPSSKLV